MSRTTGHLEADLLNALPRLLPSLKVVRSARRGKAGRASAWLVDVRTPAGRAHRLIVDARAANAPSRIPHALRQLKASMPRTRQDYPVLASTFLSPRARELCREEGIGYLDLAGNCFLQFEDFYLQKIVDKNPFPARGRPPSLFTPVSSRILRALLEEPARTWQVSELAASAQVSLGHTSNVCRRLIEEAYVATADRRVRVNRPGKLLEAWRDLPATGQQAATGYYSFERDPDALLRRVAQVARERGWRYAVTSFVAANFLAPFVRGAGILQWYVDDPRAVAPWVEALDLRPAEEGANVMLVSPGDRGVFYRTQTVDGIALVGAVQLYLDLWNESARGREQAEFLRQQVIGY